eukprot:CAMPEP_0168537702 /NCGR_PEP_ID=MMETSP0405-20121227/20559_1 /TAXON_ID=498012 /ORGANISM="Trichosphaerium sp, Strain Am-I-7 wt" /LENGTH=111 /DNA_ID=CAMNT_0008566463 /DNA_START=295 /DNA_END=630 /DNA_ORIENTATION=-
MGKPIFPGYQSHYVRVNSKGVIARPNAKTSFDEIVVSQDAQVLPKYLVYMEAKPKPKRPAKSQQKPSKSSDTKKSASKAPSTKESNPKNDERDDTLSSDEDDDLPGRTMWG